MPKAFLFAPLLLVSFGILVFGQTSTSLEPLSSGFNKPVYVTSAHDGTNRLFVVERGGRIMMLPSAGESQRVFLDITDRVLSAGWVQGLLGRAFHPQFRWNGRFFVNYTRQPDGATVVAEFSVSATDMNTADTVGRTILTIAEPYVDHNAGMIEFGPDGFLYVATGDGGSGDDPDNRAQDPNDLLGKILRIDIDTPENVAYLSPAGNPFYGNNGGREEIYAVGFRNPWRFSFDRLTGELYVADVGEHRWEEVSIVTRGGNYGWRVYEGTECTGLDPGKCGLSGFTPPLFQYDHSSGRCAVIGGYVYRGVRDSVPAGSYIYGDHCTGEIFLWNGSPRTIYQTGLNITSFGEDEEGEIYVVLLSGTIYRIVKGPCPLPAPLNLSPSGNTDSATPTFKWSGVREATQYELSLVTSADFYLNDAAPAAILTDSDSYTPSSSLPSTDYAWTVRAQNSTCGEGLAASIRTFTISGSCPLSAPLLIAPDGTATANSRPAFIWSTVPDASIYVMYVLDALSRAVVIEKALTATSFTPEAALTSGNYAWVVYAYNTSCGASASSQAVLFVEP